MVSEKNDAEYPWWLACNQCGVMGASGLLTRDGGFVYTQWKLIDLKKKVT